MERYVAYSSQDKNQKSSIREDSWNENIETFIQEEEEKGHSVLVDFFNNGKLERQAYKS